MEMAIIYFGIAQSIFAAFFSFFKKPGSIADKILGGWLIAISLLFILNLIKTQIQIKDDLWPISVSISITLPIFLYLYTKYITKEYSKFELKDFFHFIPSLVSILILSTFFSPEITGLDSFVSYYGKLEGLRKIIGWLFICCLWIYSMVAVIRIFRYKKQIANTYSFKSTKINLIWLQFVVISYLLFYHIIIIISGFQINIALINHIEIFRSGALLVFLYVLSFGGLRQQQLISEDNNLTINKAIDVHKPNDDQYLKSKLKDTLAKEYLSKLIDFMNTHEIWMDNELSIAKVADKSEIPRHYITQILNQYLQKNFNTFVNEYRIEYAKKLMNSEKYSNWSILAIAYESGFNSKATFNSFFKKYTGITPTEYKNQFNIK